MQNSRSQDLENDEELYNEQNSDVNQSRKSHPKDKSDNIKSGSKLNESEEYKNEDIDNYSEHSIEQRPEDKSLEKALSGVNIVSEPIEDSKVESELQFRLAITKLAHAMNEEGHTVHSLFCANESRFEAVDDEHHLIKVNYFKK